jgi:hypothetical protein
VRIFELSPSAQGKEKSFQLKCDHGDHLATNAEGGAVVVDLKDYDEKKLKRVLI